MSKLAHSLFYSALLTLYGGSLFFVIRFLYALAGNEDLSRPVGETITVSLLCFVLFAVLMYELEGAFDELNKSGKDHNSESQEGDNPPRE